MRGIEPATKDFGVVGRESYRDFTAAPWLEIFWRNLKKSENTKYAQKSQEHKNNDKQNDNFCNSQQSSTVSSLTLIGSWCNIYVDPWSLDQFNK